jgi:2-polyprenyl-3-methyl-5-hydroxy-6-metoxy-1,4-benzoquinol methylase
LDYSELYYKCKRPELIQQIQPGRNRILVVGCAEGLLGETLKQQGKARVVVGFELFPDVAKVAETRLDRVICGDIEAVRLEELELGAESFDYIICGDVLEHLRDPWAVLSWLVTRLKPEGVLIASLPNVRHWRVVFPLLFLGRWQYQSQGILDKTHLRFFTKQTACKLVEQSGLTVVKLEPLLQRKLDRAGKYFTLGLLSDLFAFQWLLIGRKGKDGTNY